MINSLDLLFTAILDHHRWWYAVDGIMRQMIILNGGKITPRLLRNIARDFSVSRGLRKECEGKIADILNAEMANWPNGLLERADKCIELAKRLKDDGHAHHNQISALTKLTWFLSPDGWTLYDNLAATGLGIPKNPSTVDRMKKFYRCLNDDWCFTKRTAELQAAIKGSETPELHAGRILDKLLMLHSSEEYAGNVINETRAYFEILAPETQRHLKALPTLLGEQAWRELDDVRKRAQGAAPERQ